MSGTIIAPAASVNGRTTTKVIASANAATAAAVLQGAPEFYSTVAAGEAATSSGESFLVYNDGGVLLYENVGGSGTYRAPVFGLDFATVADLQAWTETSAPEGIIIGAGGHRYEVVSSGGDITTAGGIELDVQVNDFGVRVVQAMGLVGDGQTDDQTPVDSAILAETPRTLSNISTDISNTYGRDIFPDTLVQNNSSGRLYNPKNSLENYFFGVETLQHWFSLFDEASNVNSGNTITAKIVCTGDSTTEGVGATYGGVPAILTELAKMRGYVNVNVVNRGQSGQPTISWPGHSTSWEDSYLAGDIAEDPDLLIVRWGANDPYYNVTPFGDSGGTPTESRDEVLRLVLEGYRRTLTTLRGTAGMDADNLSIVLATPGPMNDVFFGRDEVYFQRLSDGMKQMALEFQCAFIDIYGLYSNSWGGVGTWMDSDATSGTARAIHPQDELYEHIAGAIASVCLPDWGLNWQANGFRNTSGTSINRDVADTPNLYFAGLNLDRMGDGTGTTRGAPYNGVVMTEKQADGVALQTNFPMPGNGFGVCQRTGFNSAWADYWNGAVYYLNNLTYQNGFTDLGSGYAPGSYKLGLDARMHFSGILSTSGATTTDGTVIATLPEFFRPSADHLCLVATENGDCQIKIDTSGNISVYRFSGGGNYISLNSVGYDLY